MSTKVINQPDLKIRLQEYSLGCAGAEPLQCCSLLLGQCTEVPGALGTWGGWSCGFWDSSLALFCREVAEPVPEGEGSMGKVRLGSQIKN